MINIYLLYPSFSGTVTIGCGADIPSGPSISDNLTRHMERSVRYVTTPNNELSALRGKGSLLSEPPVFGLKLHLMNVVKDTRLAEMFPGYEPFGSIEEYVGLVCDLLEIIPYDVTIHRLTGDVPRSLLLTPEWSYRKRTILNGIAHVFSG